MNLRRKIITVFSLGIATLPMIGSAASSYCANYTGTANIHTVADFFNFFTCLLSASVVPLMFAAAVVLFLFGVVKFIQNANDSTEREQGKTFMIWGIVALFVMICVWGLVNVLGKTFGVQNVLPQLPPAP